MLIKSENPKLVCEKLYQLKKKIKIKISELKEKIEMSKSQRRETL